MKPFQPPTGSRATHTIIAGCVAVHILLLLTGAGDEAAFRAALIPARLAGGVVLDGAVPAWLTPLTSLFLHSGWFHLGMNMLFLLFVGRYVEWVLGPARFVLLYLAGGYAAGLAQVAAGPLSTDPVVGASGAIAAVFAAYALLFARQRVAPRRIAGISVPSGLLTALWFALIWTVLQLMTGAVLGGAIAVWSHIGGFAAGLALIRPLARGARALPL